MIEKTPIGFPVSPERDAEKKKHPDYDLIAEKFLISKGVTTERFGSPNVYQAAVNLYAGLFDPESIDRLIEPSEQFPHRIEVMKKPLSVRTEKIPAQEEFVEKIRHAMVNEVDFGECLSLEAREQFGQILERSEHTVIWTDGDAEGVPEYGLPGSREQLKKLAAAQVYGKMRREVAKERGVRHTDVLSIVAIEGKMKFIPEIVKKFIEKEIRKIVIVEDRAGNLIKAIGLIKQVAPEIDVFPVWVRLGRFKDKIEPGKTLEELADELHAIGDISQLVHLLDENNVLEEGVKVGSIFDLDGPLHDDDVRRKLQTEAVIGALQEKGWI